MSKSTPGVRYAEVEREGGGVRVQLVLDLDGGTRQDVSTGILFLDHVLAELGGQGGIDLGVVAEGDLEVDDQHTAQAVGAALGQAVATAIEADHALARFGSATIVREDGLVLAAIDLRGDGSLYTDLDFSRDRLGGLSSQSVREFFRAFAAYSQMTLHIRKLAGVNDHHVCEAAFCAVGVALHEAVAHTERTTSGPLKPPRV